ncbi:DUF3606 domain-containing protein [Variovorax sp. Sphag1AA]|uniref:DUF3606 domain-containing protein n=1 Tax=Variovorax sp. Sphag1AA TaxID=2587027 RepID=UPI00160FFC04|nr:DUF3606 domain-containing protein [Variovorax sp. Sphag1AA]
MHEIPDNKPLKGQRITLDDEQDVCTWTRSLGCSERELREAVAAVGSSAEKVRRHLAKRRWARGLGQLPRHV